MKNDQRTSIYPRALRMESAVDRDLSLGNARATTSVPAAFRVRPGWRLLLTPPMDGGSNMALDEALMEHSRSTGETVLRIYGWDRPTLSLGRHQAAREGWNGELARLLGVDVVRRPTGGRAVLHWREVTYAVTAPAPAMGTLGESYHRINRLLLAGLRSLGVFAQEAAPTARPPAPGPAPCFEEPVAGELVAQGGKLVGSAQVRDRDAMLQHGSILVEDDQWMVAELLNVPFAPSARRATLRALLGRVPAYEEIAVALSEAVQGMEGASPVPLLLDGSLHDAMRRIRGRYVADDWTWRR